MTDFCYFYYSYHRSRQPPLLRLQLRLLFLELPWRGVKRCYFFLLLPPPLSLLSRSLLFFTHAFNNARRFSCDDMVCSCLSTVTAYCRRPPPRPAFFSLFFENAQTILFRSLFSLSLSRFSNKYA